MRSPPSLSTTPPVPFTFSVGEMAVHPAHGAGQVMSIEDRELSGKKTAFYVLRILDTGAKIMVAVGSGGGLRPVMSEGEAEAVLQILKAPEVAVDVQPWNRRHRAYVDMMKSGSPFEIAKVLRDMCRLRFDKDLSFAERKLLDQAKALLLDELAIARGLSRAALEGELQSIFPS